MSQISNLTSKHLAALKKTKNPYTDSLLKIILILLGSEKPTTTDQIALISDSRNFVKKLKGWDTIKQPSEPARRKKLRAANAWMSSAATEERIVDPLLKETVSTLKDFVLHCVVMLEKQDCVQSPNTERGVTTPQRVTSTSPTCRTLSPQRLFSPVVKNIKVDKSADSSTVAGVELQVANFITDQEGISTMIFSGYSQPSDLDTSSLFQKVIQSSASTATTYSSCQISDSEFIDTTTQPHRPLTANTLKESLDDLRTQKNSSGADGFVDHVRFCVSNSFSCHHVFRVGVNLIVVLVSQHPTCRISKHHILSILYGKLVGGASSVRAHVLSRLLSNSRGLDSVLHINMCNSLASAGASSLSSLLRTKSKIFTIRYGDPPTHTKSAVELFLLLLGEQPDIEWKGYQLTLCEPNLFSRLTSATDATSIRVAAHAYRRILKLKGILQHVPDTGTVVGNELKRWSFNILSSGKVGTKYPISRSRSRSRSRSPSISVGRQAVGQTPSPSACVSPNSAGSSEWASFRRAASRDISEADLLRISRETLIKLIALYGFSNPIIAARIELYWLDHTTTALG